MSHLSGTKPPSNTIYNGMLGLKLNPGELAMLAKERQGHIR
jgi:hypothetical protein